MGSLLPRETKYSSICGNGRIFVHNNARMDEIY